jgi:molecular chaperone GrpE (heat shock protein)
VAEAVSTEPTDDPELDNRVVEELDRGYMLRGTLLRPARVRVARVERPASQPSED